jgi:hypothetical protein
MPIRKELRHLYRTPEYKAARARCRERAGDRCEQCGAPNKKTVLRAFRWWTPYTFEATLFFLKAKRDGKEVTELPWHVRDPHNVDHFRTAHFPWHARMKVVWIQCGAAHLNNVAGDDRDENLAWLCRGCHLRTDKPFHRATRQLRKDLERPLLRLVQFPAPLMADYPDAIEYCRAMQRWSLQDGDGPQRRISINDWFAEEVLLT